jgi:hypothetical protein
MAPLPQYAWRECPKHFYAKNDTGVHYFLMNPIPKAPKSSDWLGKYVDSP